MLRVTMLRVTMLRVTMLRVTRPVTWGITMGMKKFGNWSWRSLEAMV